MINFATKLLDQYQHSLKTLAPRSESLQSCSVRHWGKKREMRQPKNIIDLTTVPHSTLRRLVLSYLPGV